MISDNPYDILNVIKNERKFLIIQDIDGVCIPLVKDPLERKIGITYIYAAKNLENEFCVLTNGEHGGVRGVNKLIDDELKSNNENSKKGLYLPGLAAGGVEYQNNYGEISFPGVTSKELEFLSELPNIMVKEFTSRLKLLIPNFDKELIDKEARLSVLDTRLSPTINLNRIFGLFPNDFQLQQKVQSMLEILMEDLIRLSQEKGLNNSFFLHIAPNLGQSQNKEILKLSQPGDVGTTDIQFMISGAIKESGLLVLINKYIESETGKAPFGKKFSARDCPTSQIEQIRLCKEKINPDQMPMIVGVGDTVTSTRCPSSNKWLRGGSDRGFLTLIQELGRIFNKKNKVILVDSSGGEVDRPSLSDPSLKGISDENDPLIFDALIKEGPVGYIKWFKKLSEIRYENSK